MRFPRRDEPSVVAGSLRARGRARGHSGSHEPPIRHPVHADTNLRHAACL